MFTDHPLVSSQNVNREINVGCVSPGNVATAALTAWATHVQEPTDHFPFNQAEHLHLFGFTTLHPVYRCQGTARPFLRCWCHAKLRHLSSSSWVSLLQGQGACRERYDDQHMLSKSPKLFRRFLAQVGCCLQASWQATTGYAVPVKACMPLVYSTPYATATVNCWPPTALNMLETVTVHLHRPARQPCPQPA